MVRQKYNEHVNDYIRRFRNVKNRCFNLNIAEKELVDLVFLGLLPHIKDELEGQEFLDVNHVLQKALTCENWDKYVKQYSRFEDNIIREKEDQIVNTLDYKGVSASDDNTDICVEG
jgi:hypothetical protein